MRSGSPFILLFTTFCLLLTAASAQISPERLTAGRMDKGKWLKAGQTLRKALAKDAVNPEARYLLSLYYIAPDNAAFNVDSSLSYVRSSWKDFQTVPARDRERLKRVPLDSLLLFSLMARIDSTAFEKAKQLNTESSYQYFIDQHTTAHQRAVAIELRDEVAFLDALKINTWTSFQNFLTHYPSSHRRIEAKTRFDKLLFEDKTRSQRLSSYIQFHDQYPESPYRALTERNIFEIATAGGTDEAFHWFIDQYPGSTLSRVAKNILYTLQTAETEHSFEPSWMTDSLRHVERLNASYWVPVFKSGMYGFINDHGEEVLVPGFAGIAAEYRCGDVKSPLLMTSVGVMARNGTLLWKGTVTDLKELGLGFVLIETDSGSQVMHQSGFRIGGVVQHAAIVASRFMGLEKNGKWAVYSLAGKQLLPYLLDEITSVDSMIVITKGGKKIVTTPARLGSVANKVEFKEDFVFDEVRRWGNQNYWVRNGTLEGVIDGRLQFVIPLDRQVLRKTSFGYWRGKTGRVFITGVPRLETSSYKNVSEQGGWIRMLTDKDKHLLYERGLDRLVEGDSSWFQGQLAFLRSGDSIQVYMPSGQKLSFPSHASFQFKEYRDSSAWLVLEEKKKKAVYDAASGIKLFIADVDQIEAVSGTLFLVTKGTKKGLLSMEGIIMVPLEYDAIVSTENDTYSLLKDKKFGWYDARSKLLIKPAYDRNIKPYREPFQLAFRDKGYGFILPNGNPIGKFEWEDVQYWSDSVAWVKKNFQWILWDIRGQKVLLDNVRTFRVVKDTPLEKIYIVRQENAYGVVSSRQGILVPLQYSDIVNLGSSEIPMYFTERHIEEAGISVVVYYDHAGKIVRKQAMEAEEFEKIYCDN